MSSEEATGGGASPPVEDDLDSDVGTIFTDEEEGGKQLEEDDDDDGVAYEGRASEGDSSGSSDSDDGTEKCPICLQRFTDQEVGSPEMCEHQFCLRCITAWSKKVATCPIDRKFFSTILVKRSSDGEVIRIENVQFSNTQTEAEQYDSTPTYCEVCGRCDREERLLLCDGCDLGYHMECLDPPLEYVPIEDWFCPRCIELGVNNDEEENEAEASTSARAGSHLVRIPRTLQNERILQSIDVPQSAINDVIEAVMQGLNASAAGPSRSAAPRRTRKSRKSTPRKRTAGRSTPGSGRRKRRTKRKTRRRRRMAVDKRPNTARGRIAHHLGIMKPLPGQVYVGLPPSCKSAGSSSHSSSSSASTSTITSLRYSAGITPLRMFANDLSDLPDSWSDDEGSVALSRVPALQRSIGATLKGPPQVVAASPTTCDVLGSILKKQYILLHDKNMKISRDGTLVPSINSSKLPALTSPKHSPTQVAASPPRGDGGNNRVEPRATTCGVTNSNQQNSNQVNEAPAGNEGGQGSGNGSGYSGGSNGGSSSEGRGATNNAAGGRGGDDGFTEEWDTQNDTQKQADDDDFDIYSDIEENAEEPEKPEETEPAPVIQKPNSPSVPEKAPVAEAPVPAPEKPEAEPNDSHDSDLDEMVIDEDSLAAGSGTKSEQQSPRKESDSMVSNTGDEDRAGTPLVDEPSNFPESPESIPLPPSPPLDISDADTEEFEPSPVAVPPSPPKKVSEKPRKEYDPSEPLSSSDDEEPPKPPPVAVKALKRSPPRKKAPAPTKPAIDLSSIPIPAEESRRPVIHFSIPKRHNLIPISSLMKRQKGVAKKESKGEGPSINFTSEISKVFGGDADDNSEEDAADEENLPKISLVAEIFGSDEEEEEVVPPAVTPPVEDPPPEEPETEAKTTSIDVTSGRWKTVAEVVPPPAPPALVEPPKNTEEEPEIIEIVTLNVPARPPRRFLGVQDVETISDSSSDIEVLNERIIGGTPPRDKPTKRSRSKSPTAKRRKRKHSSSSAASLFEDGEIAERAGKRRKEKERRRKEKSKKRRDTSARRHSQGGIHSNISSSDGDTEIEWKKPSKKTSERNYREKKSRDIDADTSPAYRRRDSGSPRRRESPSHSRYSDRLSRSLSRSRTSWSRKRSRSSSNHSYNSRRRLASQLGHSRSPSHSPEPIRSRASHARRRSGSSSDGSRVRKKSRKHSASRSPKRSKQSPVDAKRKKALKKAEKNSLLKAKRKNKELRLKERLEKRKSKGERAFDDKKKEKEKKKRKREKSLSPVKAIVADGDSIVVSLSFQKDSSGGGKSSGKKSREKLARVKSKESSALKQAVSKSLLDLGAEDLSSNSESSRSCGLPKEKEIGASKVSSSADGSAAENFGDVKNPQPASEIQGDSLVTSTRDSLEPSQTTEDDYPNSTGSPKGAPEGTKPIPSISSSAHSQGATLPIASVAPPSTGGLGQKVLAASATSAALNLLTPQPNAGPAAMSTPQPPPQMRYPTPNSIFNPVLATVASALLAVRNQTQGGPSSLGKAPRKQRNFQKGDGSPMSPNSSDGDDLFEPPTELAKKGGHQQKAPQAGNISNIFDTLFGTEPPKQPGSSQNKPKQKPQSRPPPRKAPKKESSGPPPGQHQCDINLNEDFPASAVELSVQEKLINKINRQERVVEEVKVCLKPHYIKKHVNKEEYKEILRRAVPKICHSKTGEINPVKVRELVDAYVKKFRHGRKKTG